jgi:hypothetical protein
MRIRADAQRHIMEDRDWQRRREVETRAMKRVHQQMNRMKLRQPLLRRGHFRDI